MKNIIIVGFSKPSSEGIILHLNEKASLKTGNITNNEFWVSWDKIGELLFNNYTDKIEVAERNKLRENFVSPKSEQVAEPETGKPLSEYQFYKKQIERIETTQIKDFIQEINNILYLALNEFSDKNGLSTPLKQRELIQQDIIKQISKITPVYFSSQPDVKDGFEDWLLAMIEDCNDDIKTGSKNALKVAVVIDEILSEYKKLSTKTSKEGV